MSGKVPALQSWIMGGRGWMGRGFCRVSMLEYVTLTKQKYDYKKIIIRCQLYCAVFRCSSFLARHKCCPAGTSSQQVTLVRVWGAVCLCSAVLNPCVLKISGKPQTYKYACMHVWVLPAHMQTHVDMHAHTQTCTQTYTRTLHAHTYTHTHHTHTHARVCTHAPYNTHIYIHTHNLHIKD